MKTTIYKIIRPPGLRCLLLGMLALLASVPAGAQNHWTPNSNPFEDYMTITGYIVLDGSELESNRFEIGCFIDGECRGTYRLQAISYPNHSYPCFLAVWGSSSDSNKPVTLKLYDHQDQKTYEMSETITYQYGEGVGVDMAIKLGFTTTSIAPVDPNAGLLVSSFDGGFLVKNLTPGETIRVYNAQGQLLYEEVARESEMQLPISHRGIYFIVSDKKKAKAVY